MSDDPQSSTSFSVQNDARITLRSVYGFFKEPPVWVMSGLVLVVSIIQVLWMAGGRLDLAMRVVQTVDRSALLVVAVYQVAFVLGFLVMLGFPSYYIWRLICQEVNKECGDGVNFCQTFISTFFLDLALLFVTPWILFVGGIVFQFVIFIVWCLRGGYYSEVGGRAQEDVDGAPDESGKRFFGSGSYGISESRFIKCACRRLVDLLNKFFERNSRVALVAVSSTVIAAIFVPGSASLSQKITYDDKEVGFCSGCVGEIIGENEVGVVVLVGDELVTLSRGSIKKAEYCKRTQLNSDTLVTLFLRSGLPRCT